MVNEIKLNRIFQSQFTLYESSTIWLKLSVYLGPIVITLSGFHCSFEQFLFLYHTCENHRMLISARHRNDGGLNGRHVNKGWQKMKHFFVISLIGLTFGRFRHPLAIFFRVRNTFFGRPQRREVVLWISESRILNSIFAFLLSLETKNLLW